MASLREYLQRIMSQLLEDEMKSIYGSIWYFCRSPFLLSMFDQLNCCMPGLCMGDHLWAGKPSRCVIGHLGQLSLPSLCGMVK